jgi:hypothetical protein
MVRIGLDKIAACTIGFLQRKNGILRKNRGRNTESGHRCQLE